MIILTISYWQIILGFVIFFLFLFITWKTLYSSKVKTEHISLEYENLKDQKQEILMRLTKKEYQHEQLSQNYSHVSQKLQRAEYLQEQREKDFYEKATQLDVARSQFIEEREKQKQEKISEQEHIQKNWNREWNEHENQIINILQNACAEPLTSFTSHTNNSLPSSFPIDIKPDFVVRSAEKYIVFDAKKSKNIESYIYDQTKKTAEKYKNCSIISKLIFFIIPEQDLLKVKNTVLCESGYTFFIISKTSISQTLMLLKKLEYSQEISELSGDDQENIMHLLGQYDRHISVQNATNIVLAEKSFEIEEQKKLLSKKLQSELALQKNIITPLRLSPQQIQKYAFSMEISKSWIESKTKPVISIDSKKEA